MGGREGGRGRQMLSIVSLLQAGLVGGRAAGAGERLDGGWAGTGGAVRATRGETVGGRARRARLGSGWRGIAQGTSASVRPRGWVTVVLGVNHRPCFICDRSGPAFRECFP